VASIALFTLAFAGLAYSFYPYVVPEKLTIYEAASAPESLIIILVGGRNLCRKAVVGKEIPRRVAGIERLDQHRDSLRPRHRMADVSPKHRFGLRALRRARQHMHRARTRRPRIVQGLLDPRPSPGLAPRNRRQTEGAGRDGGVQRHERQAGLVERPPQLLHRRIVGIVQLDRVEPGPSRAPHLLRKRVIHPEKSQIRRKSQHRFLPCPAKGLFTKTIEE
jgi:hypothetical protein